MGTRPVEKPREFGSLDDLDEGLFNATPADSQTPAAEEAPIAPRAAADAVVAQAADDTVFEGEDDIAPEDLAAARAYVVANTERALRALETYLDRESREEKERLLSTDFCDGQANTFLDIYKLTFDKVRNLQYTMLRWLTNLCIAVKH